MEELEDDYVASEHEKLISAVSRLDKTQYVKAPTRSEPTNLNSEFTLVKTRNKLDITNAVRVLKDTAHLTKIGKKLKRSVESKRVLPKPLEKPQAERIKRATGYEETKTRVGRWDPVVARSRTVDFVSFPLKRPVNKLEPTKEFLTKLISKSSLEKELEEVDPTPHVEPEDEEEHVYPSTYEDMLQHRQRVAKLRAAQSYKAAKAKRQGKIKSKKYHRILRKEKLKLQLKEFEEMQITNPEEALKKLEALEKARALERHTLRHKNTGKWAKNKLVRAKYDKEVRQQLAEQLAVSRGLTRKVQNKDSSDDDEEVNDGDENIPDIKVDPMNPWAHKKLDQSTIDGAFEFGYKNYLKGKMLKLIEESDSDENDNNNTNVLSDMRNIKNSITNIQKQNCEILTKRKQGNQDMIVKETDHSKIQLAKEKSRKTATATTQWLVEELEDEIKLPCTKKVQTTPSIISDAFESFEHKLVGRVEQKINKIRKSLKRLEAVSKKDIGPNNTKDEKEFDNLENLKLKNMRLKPNIDEGLIETSIKDIKNVNEELTPLKVLNLDTTPKTENETIDPDKLTKYAHKNQTFLDSALPVTDTGIDGLDDDEQVVPTLDIDDPFEDQEIVTDFRKEKEDEVNKGQPTDVDKIMPGWGSWGGKGVKTPKRKRNRFITKHAPKVTRKDENKGDIIIKEFKDPKIAVHKVKNVPFPFNSVKDYEASIRAPIGNTFIPEKAHKKLIRPSIITKVGTIIDPMDEDELIEPRNNCLRNENVLKLLGQK